MLLLSWLLPCGVSGGGPRRVGDLLIGGPFGPGVLGVLGGLWGPAGVFLVFPYALVLFPVLVADKTPGNPSSLHTLHHPMFNGSAVRFSYFSFN